MIMYSRLIFIITCLLIANNTGPTWLTGMDGDWFKSINMILFAFTNGYASTLCAIHAICSVEDKEKEQVGTFIGFTITFGILLGALVAMIMPYTVMRREDI